MKTGAVRAGVSLVGVASALVLPGVATGQVDVGDTVGKAVDEVGGVVEQVAPQATPVPVTPAPVPAPAPAQPAPKPGPSSAPAPSPSAGGGGAAGTAASGSGSGAGSGSKASAGKSGSSKGGAAKASASSKKGSGKGTVLAAQDDQPLTPRDGESFSGAVTTNPSTGVVGDPELPFTGFQALLLLAMGGIAVAAGLALRTAARRRHVG